MSRKILIGGGAVLALVVLLSAVGVGVLIGSSGEEVAEKQDEEKQKPAPVEKKESPKKTSQKTAVEQHVLGKWNLRDGQCNGTVALLSQRSRRGGKINDKMLIKTAEFLENGRLLLDTTAFTYTFLDSNPLLEPSRMEVKPSSGGGRTIVYTVTPRPGQLRIEEGSNGCTLTRD
jgi:hypothetical protein